MLHPAQAHGRARGARARDRAAATGRASPRRKAARRLSAPAVGRPAPARHDRHGARQRARHPDRRRAHHRARRHHPGADPDAAEGAPGALRHGAAAHHPRPRHRAQDGRPRLRHDQGRDRRGRRRSRVFAAPQHPYTRRLLAAEPKGAPPSADADAAGPGRGRRPQGLVPDQARLPAPHRRPHQGGRRRLAARARRRDARASSANRARARPRSASRCCGSSPAQGAIVFLAARIDGLSSAAHAAAAARDADRLPGPVWLACRRAFGRRRSSRRD